MLNFTHDTPTRLHFGKGQICHLEEELNRFGKRVLLTYGGGSIKKIGLYDEVMEILNKGGFTVVECGGIEPNPRIDSVRKGAQMCKDHNIDVLLAVGGGNFIYRWTKGESLYQVFVLLTTAILGTWILLGLTRFMDFESRENVLIHSISDYVSNYLNQKLAFEYKEQAGKVSPEQYKRALQEIAVAGIGRRKERKPKYYYDEYGQDGIIARNDEVDAKIVEDVLKEFLC